MAAHIFTVQLMKGLDTIPGIYTKNLRDRGCRPYYLPFITYDLLSKLYAPLGFSRDKVAGSILKVSNMPFKDYDFALRKICVRITGKGDRYVDYRLMKGSNSMRVWAVLQSLISSLLNRQFFCIDGLEKAFGRVPSRIYVRMESPNETKTVVKKAPKNRAKSAKQRSV